LPNDPVDSNKNDLAMLLEKSHIKNDIFEDPFYSYDCSPNDESLNHRVETYHLEDLGSQVIEEKAEEEEASTVHVYSNKPSTEDFDSKIWHNKQTYKYVFPSQ
jgi:hypothetical protein